MALHRGIRGGARATMPSDESAAYRRTVTVLLMSAYTFNSMDRSIISIIAASLKADLSLSDTELGLLGGTAFAALYALSGIPIARLAERVSRVNIITVALLVWSALTALCAAAGGFISLLAIRAGVGVAEAGCSPPAHSLISDYHPPAERASALSVYSCGISLGYILAAVVGGYVAEHAGWRAACLAVGAPGVLTALIIKGVVREPPRGRWDSAATPRMADNAGFSLAREVRELRAVAAALLLNPPVRHMVLGITLGGFAAYGFYAFVPPYFSRAFGLGYAATGFIAAFTGGVTVGFGILAGGFVADRLARHRPRWYALVPALGGLLALPLYVAAVSVTDWRGAATALGAAGFFQYASLGPTFGVVQNAVGAHRRATATALLYICLSVIALGLGPLFAGWAIDRFADHLFAGGGRTFEAACPGGGAAIHAAPAMALACRSTLALATRRGLLITLAFFAWGVVHYFMAAAGFESSRSGANEGQV
jgi:predicted MFS family arabinose efflux permease